MVLAWRSRSTRNRRRLNILHGDYTASLARVPAPVVFERWPVSGRMVEMLGKCQMLGCNDEAHFLIRSLRSEADEGGKWLFVCDLCEKRLAAENALVIRLAASRGMSVAKYVEHAQGR